MSFEENLKKLKIELPDPPAPVGSYTAYIKSGNFIFVSGQISLEKNGNLIISVPAFQYLYTDYDRKIGHYRRYDKKSFEKIFNKLKLKSYQMTYFDSIGYALIFLSKFLAVSNRVNFRGSVKLWNFLIPISKILDVFLSIFIGKSLMVIITKY